MLGSPPMSVDGRLRELGVELIPSRPHPLDAVARQANKLLGLREPTDGPVLLVDNDVCLLTDVTELEGRNVRATLEGRARVSEEQWDHIAATTGLRPLATEWVPLHEEVRAREKARSPVANGRLYLNSGVVWVRRPLVFEALWAASIEAIANAFDGHPLSTRWVQQSDQVGLATAVAEHGGFDPLSPVYNCYSACLRLGLAEQAKILHLTKLPLDALGFSNAIVAYWENRVLGKIRRAKSGTDTEQERILDEATSVRDRLLRLVAESGLDSFSTVTGEL